MDRAPWVRVVIVNYNGGEHIAAAVSALASQGFADFEAVIVDNDSTDGSADRLDLPDRRFRLIKAGRNIGFAAGSNLGAKGTTAGWIALLNPDAVPEVGWLEALRRATLRHADCAAFGSTQLMAQDPTLLDGAGDCYSIFGIAWRGGHGAPAELMTGDAGAFSPCAAAALYRRDVWEEAGGMAESFFCYLEDVDLGWRLRLAGHRTVQVADARVLHVGSAITGRHSAFTLFHSTRNGILMQIRCMPLPLLALSLPLYLLAQCWLMTRTEGWRWRVKGLSAGLRAIPATLEVRKTVQNRRYLSAPAVARLLIWDPRRVSRREIVRVAE